MRDISHEPYCGISGRHEVDGKAINTTNGAGPHNIQMFILAPDGTVLTCLQGFWNAQDLVEEMGLANQLNNVWQNPEISRAEKNRIFTQMHLQHIAQHSQQERKRSHLQSFDAKYEAKNRLQTSDCIVDTKVAAQANVKGAKIPYEAFKTTDVIMHERMAMRPFENYNQFDVATYVDYGRNKYDKHEDQRGADGQVNKAMAKNAPVIGNPSAMQSNQQQNGSGTSMVAGRVMRRMLRMGIRAAL